MLDGHFIYSALEAVFSFELYHSQWIIVDQLHIAPDQWEHSRWKKKTKIGLKCSPSPV